MTDGQNDKYGMYMAVAKFFDTYSSVFNPLPQFPPRNLQLKNAIVKIKREGNISTTNNKGITQLKATEREKLEGVTQKVSESLLSFGAANGDPYIIERDDYLRGALTGARDSDLYVSAVLLFRKADPVKASLPPYGSTPADVALLNTTAESFLMLMREPATVKKVRSRSVAQLRVLFAETDALLAELDTLLKVFQYNAPELYSQYRSARSIVNLSGGHRVHKKKGRVLAGFMATAPFTAKALKGVKHFILYNESKQKDSKLVFYFSATAHELPHKDAKLVIVKAGERTEVTVAESGYAPNTPHLNIYNPNAQTGHWKAEVKKE